MVEKQVSVLISSNGSQQIWEQDHLEPAAPLHAKYAIQKTIFAPICPQIGDLKPKCGKCRLPHQMENCGIRSGYCSDMDHTEDRCWKNGKDGKALSATNNDLQVLVDDEEAALEQLIRLCGTKHHIFSRARIPGRRFACGDQHTGCRNWGGFEAAGERSAEADIGRDATSRSKILTKFHLRQDCLVTHGNHPVYSRRARIPREFGEIGMEEAG